MRKKVEGESRGRRNTNSGRKLKKGKERKREGDRIRTFPVSH